MGKALTKVENKDLEILQGEGEISEAEAFFVAAILEEKESDIRLLKGMLWNKCKHGTKEKICVKHGWKEKTLEEYARFAREIDQIPVATGVSYTQWNAARQATMGKEERIEILKLAAENSWSNKEIREHALKELTKDIPKPKQVYKGTGDADKGRKARDEARFADKVAASLNATKELTPQEAFNVFGLDKGYWITKESLNVLFKYYSKTAHPDTGGSTEAMALLNQANELLKGIAR